MSFEPAGKDHAIIEAVFGLELTRGWHPKEINRLIESEDSWKEELPRMASMDAHEFQFGPLGAQTNVVPASGVSFERVKPNGEISWRLICERNTIFVNCLDYTRWEEVWNTVKRYINKCINCAEIENQGISAVTLQYIDLFSWNKGIERYDAGLLLNLTGQDFPLRLQNNGAVWHYHTGWFEDHTHPFTGPVLNRLHLDAVKDKTPKVKIDHLLRKQLPTTLPLSGIRSNDQVDLAMNWMHDRNKEVLRQSLTHETASMIGLI